MEPSEQMVGCSSAAAAPSIDTPESRTSTGCQEPPPASEIAMDWELESEEILGEEFLPDSQVALTQSDLTLTEILESFMAENIDEEKLTIIARRRNALQSIQLAMSKSSFSWKKVPHVEFVGEMAADYGGPRREFLRLLLVELHTTFGVFEGQPGKLFFTYDVASFVKKKYFTAGKLTAWSIFHNGPGPRGMEENLFLMMCGQRAKVTDQLPALPVDTACQNIEKVWNCNSPLQLQQLKDELGDWVASCGMPSINGATLDDLPALRLAVIEHHIFHRFGSMVAQYKEGFNSCGNLWQVVEGNCMQFLPVFVNTGEKLDRSCIRSLFTIKWSLEESNRKEMEEQTIFWWDWWLVAIQDGDVDVSFEELLVFVSGADCIPPLGFLPKPSIQFYDQEPGERRLPFVSTCSLTLSLPRGIESEEDFKELMEMSIKGSHGFGKV